MRRMFPRYAVVLGLVVLLALPLVLAVGCGEQQVKVMTFLGPSSKSYETMKTVLDSLKKKYKGKVVFVDVDYDDPNNKSELEKYHVSMNPTVLIFNTKGEIKQTYMGTAREDMIDGAIASFLPSEQKPPSSSATSSGPGVATTPATPYPPGQGTVPMTIPGTTP
ncbi:MAG: thioredoxin domain-containing protein [Actinomycetota bacterium]